MRRYVLAAALLAMVPLAGCEKATPAPKQEAGTNQAVEASGASATIGTMLQYDTLKAGRRAQDKARAAAAAHNERLKESIPDDPK